MPRTLKYFRYCYIVIQTIGYDEPVQVQILDGTIFIVVDQIIKNLVNRVVNLCNNIETAMLKYMLYVLSKK